MAIILAKDFVLQSLGVVHDDFSNALHASAHVVGFDFGGDVPGDEGGEMVVGEHGEEMAEEFGYGVGDGVVELLGMREHDGGGE